MKKIVYQSKAIQIVIGIIAIGLLLSLWPFRIWKETVVSGVVPQSGTFSSVIDEQNTVLQTIVAQYNHMDTIDVYLSEESIGDNFYLRILDEQWQQVCEEKATINKELLPGFQEVMIDIDMEVGKMYYIILQGEESEIFAGCEFVPLTDMPYLGTLYYADTPMEGMSLTANYNYSVPLRKDKVFLFGAGILIVAALLMAATRLVYQKKTDKLVTVEKVMKWTLNPVVAVFTVLSLLGVVTGFFGKYVLDNTVFFISTLLLSLLLFYGINHNRDGQEPVVTWNYLKSHGADLIQSVGIAGAIAGCCEYMNGLYDIHHSVAERKEMLWFALAMIAMFQWKEIINIYNVIYLAAAGCYGYHYYQTHLTEEMGELEIQVLKSTIWVAILLGLIMIRTVIALFRKKLEKPAFGYAALLTVFFAMLIIFRNGRWWGVALVVAFTLFYLSYGMWEHKERFFVNVTRGVVLQFIWSTGYCLLHRPYVTFRNARYTHIFHTVTITATYLTMVDCVAAVMLLEKLTKSRKLKDTWKEWIFFGVVSSYMIFTMARTAFLAIGVGVFFAVLIMSVGKGKEKLISVGENLGLMVLAVLICLPVTFTLQRNIPALVSEPYLHEIEYSMYCPEDVMRGRRVDSHNFMRVGRFIDVFSEKIFNIPEGTFDIYGEQRAYKLEHGIKDEARRNSENQKEPALKKIPGVTDNSQLVASADYIPEGAQDEEDYTNGRLDIFRSYIEQSNMTGHEEMGAVLENGEIATHAHNIYLQVIYDHGYLVGIVFIIVGAVSLLTACLYYYRKRETIAYAALAPVIIITVATAGMVEWIFHISNPCGLLLMLVITPLVFGSEG